MLMALDLKRTYTAILDNAYQVSYEKIENKIGSLDFTMPLDDPKNEFIEEIDDKEDIIDKLHDVKIQPTIQDTEKHTQAIDQ